jgi:hypothetical protein
MLICSGAVNDDHETFYIIQTNSMIHKSMHQGVFVHITSIHLHHRLLLHKTVTIQWVPEAISLSAFHSFFTNTWFETYIMKKKKMYRFEANTIPQKELRKVN